MAKMTKEDHPLFDWSLPGYSFIEVEKAISDYQETIEEVGDVLEKKDEIIRTLNSKIEKLESEVTEAKLELQYIDDAKKDIGKSTYEVLHDFSSDHGSEFELSSEDKLELGIVEKPSNQDQDEDIFGKKKNKINKNSKLGNNGNKKPLIIA